MVRTLAALFALISIWIAYASGAQPLPMEQHACSQRHSAPTGIIGDAEWPLIAPLLPCEGGRRGRPSFDNRLMLEAMLIVVETGIGWRQLDPRYGKWNSVYMRFKRWTEQGVIGEILPLLLELRLTTGQLTRQPALSARQICPSPPAIYSGAPVPAAADAELMSGPDVV